jgi:DNA-binding transcriptional LysR family regulator
MGISIIPASLCSEHAGIKFIELVGVPNKTELFAVWAKTNNNPALPYIIDMLKESA